MISARPLLGICSPSALRIWLWNLEDPQEETERRIQAAALHYGMTPDDIGDRRFVDSGRDQPLAIADGAKPGGGGTTHPRGGKPCAAERNPGTRPNSLWRPRLCLPED